MRNDNRVNFTVRLNLNKPRHREAWERLCSGSDSHTAVIVETVCLLSKLSEVKNYISVKIDMDEMDVMSAESKDTLTRSGNGFRTTTDSTSQT